MEKHKSSGSSGTNIKSFHSDDQIDPRRGLDDESSFRSENPKKPELLRQSTHSLLRKTKPWEKVDYKF